MGIFDFLNPKKQSPESNKKSKEEQLQILSRLGINPFDFNHDEMDSSEVSLTEEVAGAVKVSELIYDNADNEWDYISLTDNKDGSKSLYLAQNNREERAIKVLVDKYFSVFGEAQYIGGEFSKYDLITMNEQLSGELREWHLHDFKIVVGFNYRNEDLYTNYVLVEEKIH